MPTDATPLTLHPDERRDLADGRLSVIWRKVEPQHIAKHGDDADGCYTELVQISGEWVWLICPLGKPGDVLWVAEPFDIVDDPAASDPADDDILPPLPPEYIYNCKPIKKRGPNGERWVVDYECDKNTRIMDKVGSRVWKPAADMPTWAARYHLRIQSISVQQHGPADEWHWRVEVERVEPQPQGTPE